MNMETTVKIEPGLVSFKRYMELIVVILDGITFDDPHVFVLVAQYVALRIREEGEKIDATVLRREIHEYAAAQIVTPQAAGRIVSLH